MGSYYYFSTERWSGDGGGIKQTSPLRLSLRGLVINYWRGLTVVQQVDREAGGHRSIRSRSWYVRYAEGRCFHRAAIAAHRSIHRWRSYRVSVGPLLLPVQGNECSDQGLEAKGGGVDLDKTDKPSQDNPERACD